MAGILALAAASAAMGQQQPATNEATTAESGGLQEVVVTAERRAENIQSVPIAVSAFTADQLQSRNLTDVHTLGALSPGVNLDAGAPFSGDRSVLSASIRGVGQDDFAFNLNPAVGVYLDGVYLARTIGANQNLLDVDRVEILKGPQGTLFGANTEGGAISIVTHTPGNEQRFVAQATGGSLDRRDFAFTTDLPIIKDTLLSSITVSSQVRDGWVKVIPYPTNSPYGEAPFVVDPQTAYPKSGYQTSDNYGGYNTQSIRAKLLWNASDKLTVTTTADWTHQDQTALPYTVLGVFTGNVAESTFSTLYNLCISNSAASLPAAIQANVPAPLQGAYAAGGFLNSQFAQNCSKPRAQVPGLSTGGAALIGAGYVGGPPGPYNYNNHPGTAYLGTNQPRLWFNYAATNTGNIDTTYANGPDFARLDSFGGSITAAYSLTDDISLKSISGYRQIRWLIGTDLDGTPETLQEVSDHQHQWQVSQEFQVNGKAFDNALNYVAGLYYFEEAGYVHDYVPFEGILYVYDLQNDVNNKNEAAFFHADYRLGQWGFTAGGRYTDVQEEFIGGQADLNDFPSAALSPPNVAQYPGVFRYFPPGDNSQSWRIFDPTVGIQYHINDDVMAYLSWGKGFKAGGWTTRLSAQITSASQAQFSPESTKTWELGLKSSWFNNHLRANVAAFYTDYDNIQLNIQQGISPVYTNAGNAKIKGGELELQSIVGHGLAINFAGSYIDAYYTYVNPYANIPQSILPDGTNVCPSTQLAGVPPKPICALQPAGVTQLDAELPKTPKYKLSLYPTYDFLLPNTATLRLIADFTYTAHMYNDSLNTPQLYRPPTRMVDAAIHYISPDNTYDVSFGGTNLTNDRFITAGSPNIGAGEVGGYYNEPREWYLQVQARFGGK
ncbi:MAG TPA: TonB-dependent receptor [Steroidobacteraceae bacterium]|nr:TonB-dependent receptor [Steroidobacteraceae bacterium]